jgi:hypothetical protein
MSASDVHKLPFSCVRLLVSAEMTNEGALLETRFIAMPFFARVPNKKSIPLKDAMRHGALSLSFGT